ncbi:MAG TPA: tRNA epoxyqueuosine(34) reductase QueG [Longimicrobiales bacterium]|nr:tRNA epoxyqueuosine(34) reductase QueG [Longimicrobiales bacterium]
MANREAAPAAATLAARLKARALAAGFGLAGVCALRPSDHADFLRAWLEAGYHGDMAYLARTDAVERRADPRTYARDLRSALVVADFYGAGAGDDTREPDRGVVARYARGRDYHRVVKGKVRGLLRWLEAEAGHSLPAARACVDTSPVLERELARRAGLGWFGRNTMLIHPRRGSYFCLGVLLTELELTPDAPFEADHCGTCRACLDACPTGALLGRDEKGAPVMDARRCISYLTIEHRGPIPRELRPAIGNRLFGCDICQEVCPFTRTFSKPSAEPAYASRAPGELPFGVEPEPGSSSAHPGTASPSLIELLETALDEAAWDSFSRGSAIRRAGRAGFARNVCVGLGNWGSPEGVPVLTSALSDPEPLVRAHAAWALGRVGSPEAREALSSRSAVESEESVASELAAALAP